MRELGRGRDTLRWVVAREDGGVAQLCERLLCKQDVIGSIPFTSTIDLRVALGVWCAIVEFNR